MKYYRFPRGSDSLQDRRIDTLIDCLENKLKIETTDQLDPDGIYFVGGPISSYDQLTKLKENDIRFINIDKGYFRNRKATSHWRLTFNKLQQDELTQFKDNNNRLNAFEIELQDWKKDGEYILILAPNDEPCQFITGKTPLEWALETRRELLKHTDRKIFIRYKDFVKKGYDPFEKYLDNCYAVVTLQSVGALVSTIHGIPCINLAETCTDAIYKNKLEDIENLVYPDNREELLNSLAYCQFLPVELENGFAVKTLEEINGSFK